MSNISRVLTIVGARPQFIKAAPVCKALAEAGLHEVLVHTGQHFDALMSDVFFEELDIPKPAYNLEVNSLGHGAMTGRMLERIEETLIAEKPDLVVIYGDTNSTVAGALAAIKLHIPEGNPVSHHSLLHHHFLAYIGRFTVKENDAFIKRLNMREEAA